MAVHLSKPPKPLTVTRSEGVHGIRWRTPEERREARRKIEAIRRDAERAHQELGTPLDLSALRSPKAILFIVLALLLIGMAILYVLARPALAVQDPERERALMMNRARRSVSTLAVAMTLYRVHTGGWPSQRLGLFALAKNYQIPGWKGPYINWANKDPWSTPYVYRMPLSPFQAPELFSCGPDSLPDTNDDIRAAPEDFACGEGTWRREEPVEPLPEESSDPHLEVPAETHPAAPAEIHPEESARAENGDGALSAIRSLPPSRPA